ncbi:putative manganese efflux pump MntP [Marinithermofilum abyssi]|uniref:Putative manganese efflux pump MntP n=1 Tax=Marinithermofilum abyssi TaxID=1571185 RepID=A0A8J2YCW8_9BACL|nr:manganese efflux pump [Marinithermofilum abyssi]GGE05342.1 putative manganese efflux pump MntP [Marinithermofilum abyssi]
MELSLPQWGQLFTLGMIAIALGMDAFSLGIGMGMRGLLKRQIVIVSSAIGLFHMLMPLLGIGVGRFLSVHVENIAVMVGGGLLCFLGINMLVHSIRGGEDPVVLDVTTLWGVLFFSLSVSLDSLSAGLSLGLFDADVILAVLLFGMMGGLMGGIGMWLGRNMGTWIGVYGEAVGGLILLFLGLRFIL